MTHEQENAEKSLNFGPIPAILLMGLTFLLTATLLISGVAWLLNVAGIGLSLDARFLMATMFFCALVVAASAILLATVFAHYSSTLFLDENRPENTRAADFEFDEEELAHRVMAKIFMDQLADDLLRNQRSEESIAKPRQHPEKSVGSRKRR